MEQSAKVENESFLKWREDFENERKKQIDKAKKLHRETIKRQRFKFAEKLN